MKLTVLSGLTLSCSLMATEFRAPLVLERGPLRYDFDMKAEKWSLNFWNGMYCRNASKAFIKHGTETETFTKLFFNKDNFKIAEIFAHDENGFDVDQLYQFKNSNPIVMETRIAPRAVYQERGVVLGGRFEYPIWNNKGRIGLRAAVPIRTVRIERDDEAECSTLPVQDLVINGDQTYIRGGDVNGIPTGIPLTGIMRYKLSLINRLKYFNSNGALLCALNLRNTNRQNRVTLFDNQYDRADASTSIGSDLPFVVMKGREISNLGDSGDQCDPCFRALTGPPVGAPTAITTGNLNAPLTANSIDNNALVGRGSHAEGAGQLRFGENVAHSATRLKNLPVNGVIDDGVGYAFVTGTNYTNMPLEAGYDDLWLSQIARGDGEGFAGGLAGFGTAANEDLQTFSSNMFIQNLLVGKFQFTDPYCWLRENCGLLMQSNERTGLGDIDLDLFYEHTFNDEWRVEGMLGIRFPTSTENKCNNVFAVALGNRNHFEIKVGGMGVWQPIDWVNVKLDLMYSFALQAHEKVPAAFKGSCVKGFGPCVAADVDWGYFLGRLDFNFFYCKADLSSSFGYELYYKTKDNICYKCSTTKCHCLGQVWSLVDGTPITCNTPDATVQAGNAAFRDYEMQLDNCAAARGTERIAHRVRFETHWRATKCLSLYMGGAYTFAGKNMPQESDIHAGITVYY